MNKKSKRYLSLLLAIVMAFSTMTVAFSTFAADRPLTTAEQIKAAILADYKAGGSAPKLADDIKAAYVALGTEEKKDSVGGEAVNKLFRMSYNATSGSGASKVEASVKALGGYTTKQQAAMDLGIRFWGNEKVTVGDQEVVPRYTFYAFNADYPTSGVTYTKDFQKTYFEKLIADFKAMQADPYVNELANSVYSSTSHSYYYGNVYFAPTNNMMNALLKYAKVYAPDKTGEALQNYVFETLGLKADPTSPFDIKGTMDEYASQKYQDVLAAYNSDKPGQEEAFVALVKPAFDKASDANSLEYRVASMSIAIIWMDGKLKTMNEIWKPVKDAYQNILDTKEATPVVKTFNDLDLKTVDTLDKATALVNTYNALSSGGKTVFNADKAAKAKYDAVVKVQQTFQTEAFRKIVEDTKLVTVTEANANDVIKAADACTAEYNKLAAALKNFIKSDYKDIQTKYESILNQRKEARVMPFAGKVNAFDLKAEKGEALNAKIVEIQTLYKALSADELTYVKANKAKEYAKFNDVLKCWDYTKGEDLHVMFDEVVLPATNDPLTPIIGETLLPKLDVILETLLTTLLGGTDTSTAVTHLFTNESITVVIKLVLPIIYDLLASQPPIDLLGQQFPLQDLFAVTPSTLPAIFINGDTGECTVPQLEKAMAIMATGKYEKWTDLPDDFDWGVKPGDYDSFMDSLLPVLLRGLNGGLGGGIIVAPWATNVIAGTYKLLPDESGIDLSTFNPGLYDSFFIPLLEALGAKDVPTAAEFAWEVKGTETIAFLDTMVRPVVDELYGKVLTPLMAEPGAYLTKTLPNLVYHLEDGCLFNGLISVLKANPIPLANLNVGELLEGLLGGDVSLKGIFNMLTQPTTDADGNVTAPILDLSTIGLTYEDITVLSKLGTPKKVATASTKESTIQVEGNADSVANWLSQLLARITATLGVDFSVKGEFVKQEAPKYPHNGKMDKKVMNAVVDGLDGMLGGVLKIKDLINNGLCTQEMAANAITGIYGALEGVLGGIGIAVTPKNVADFMAEEKYDDLRADLQQDTWADVGLVLKNDTETIHQTKMGFKDGDRQGFVDCVVASLRPLVKALADFGLLVNSTADDGTVAYGLYETLIIPVFEAIGLTPAATSATYTENYRKLALKEDKNQGYDYLVKTILSPVLGLLETLETAPAATLMKLLPNVAYALQYNPELAFVGNLLRNDAGDIDLAGMINPLLKDLLPGFELPAIPLDALASCGTLKEKDSKSALHETYTTVEADKTDAFVTVYYYLYDTINYKGNMDALKKMLGEMEGIDPSLMGLINSLLNEIFTASKEESLCKLGALLASDVWECPDAKDANGNSGNKTPSTGDYAISAAAFLAVMFTAGAAIVLLRRKKAVQN